MNVNDIDILLKEHAEREKKSLQTTTAFDERIRRTAREFTPCVRQPLRFSPLIRKLRFASAFAAVVCLCILVAGTLLDNRTSTAMEKDCLQFYADLTKAIHEKDVSEIMSTYGCDIGPSEQAKLVDKLNSFFNQYESLTYNAKDVMILTQNDEAVLKSDYTLTAKSINGTSSLIEGKDRLYLKKTAGGLKLCLWISE